jgi:hypothetical protein
MQRLDRWITWDLSPVQMHAFSIESPFLGCRQQFPGRAMNRFLHVAIMFSCGDLESVQGCKTEQLVCLNPLMVYQHAHSNLRFLRMNFFMVPTWC